MTWNGHGIWCGFGANLFRRFLMWNDARNLHEKPCHIFYRVN